MAFLAPIGAYLATAASTTAAAASTAAATVGPWLTTAGAAIKTAAPWISLGASGLSALSAIGQGRQQSAMLEQQADMEKETARQKAEAAGFESLRLSRERRQMIGAQYTLYGASGVEPGVGSPLQIYGQTARDYEQDIALSGWNASQALSNSATQVQSLKWQSKMRQKMGYLDAAATFAGGLGRSLLRG